MEDKEGNVSPRERSLDERIAMLRPGHRRNPLTTSLGGGRVLSALQMPWFALLPPKGYCVLTTIGRKSGKKRRRCLRVIHRGSRGYMVSIGGPDAAWIKNIRANPHVQLRARGGTFQAIAHEITDPDEMRDAHDAFCRTVNPADFGAFLLHMRGAPTPRRIRELLSRWFSVGIPLVVEIIPSHRRLGRATAGQ
jgi:deazaflavin-dependent oxidoreductase (nitroreductase family)